jgi:hypothetical protein
MRVLVVWVCATSRKVAGLIPDGMIGIFHSPNPSGRTVALGSTPSHTERSARHLPCGQRRPARRADSLAIYICRLPRYFERLNLFHPWGPIKTSYGIALCFNLHCCSVICPCLTLRDTARQVRSSWSTSKESYRCSYFIAVQRIQLIPIEFFLFLYCVCIICEQLKTRKCMMDSCLRATSCNVSGMDIPCRTMNSYRL